MNQFVISYYFSVIVQVLSLLIQGYGYTLRVPSFLYPLKYALNIEFFVSLIEIIVYLWIGFNLKNFNSVMSKRYLDWFITTNFLMVTFSLIFIFFNDQTINSHDKEYNFNTLILDNTSKLLPILLFNNLMLIVGLMGEKKKISKLYSTSIGFLFFILGFYYLYEYFAKFTSIGIKVFYTLVLIWSLYGVAHTLSEKWKNVSYNLLDLVSKNIFGVVLVWYILQYKN